MRDTVRNTILVLVSQIQNPATDRSSADPESSSHKTATKYKAQLIQIKYKPGPSGMRTVRQGVSEAASALKVT